MYKNRKASGISEDNIGDGISFVDRNGHRVTAEITSVTRSISPASGQPLSVTIGLVAGDYENPADGVYQFSPSDVLEIEDGS